MNCYENILNFTQRITFLGKSDIMKGKTLRQIHEESEDDLPPVSQFRNLCQLYNIKSRTLSSKEDLALTIVPMDQQLIKQIQESNEQYMQSLTYSSDRYCHINFNKNSISDVECFCVNS